MPKFTDLMKVIAAEALYKHSRERLARQRILMSREEFAKSTHNVKVSVDGLLWLFQGGFLELPTG